jgi:hypothetical protein
MDNKFIFGKDPVVPPPTNPRDPTIEIRTDLWNTMSLAQLTKQRELLLDRINTLQRIPDQNNPSIRDLFLALQYGLDDITKLIDYKTEHQQQIRRPM